MELSKSSTYSLIATGITFLALLIFYAVKKPDFVKVLDDSTGKKVFSLRLSLVYALLFSSSMGLVVLAISALIFRSSDANAGVSPVPSSVETNPSVGSGKSTYGYGHKGKSLKACCGAENYSMGHDGHGHPEQHRAMH